MYSMKKKAKSPFDKMRIFRDENGGSVRFCVIIGGNHHVLPGGLPGWKSGEAQKK